MPNLEKLALLTAIVGTPIGIILQVIGLTGTALVDVSIILPNAGIIILVLSLWALTLIIGRWVYHQFIIYPEQRKHDHLKIHYSDLNDHPQAKQFHRPYLVMNSSLKRARWVSAYIHAKAKNGIIDWTRHDGEQALNKWLVDHAYDLKLDFASPADLETAR